MSALDPKDVISAALSIQSASSSVHNDDLLSGQDQSSEISDLNIQDWNHLVTLCHAEVKATITS